MRMRKSQLRKEMLNRTMEAADLRFLVREAHDMFVRGDYDAERMERWLALVSVVVYGSVRVAVPARPPCRDPRHAEPFACHREAEGGFVCESTRLLEQEGPRLGLATTEQLLRELSARGDVNAGGNGTALITFMIAGLTPEQLAYRPVDQ